MHAPLANAAAKASVDMAMPSATMERALMGKGLPAAGTTQHAAHPTDACAACRSSVSPGPVQMDRLPESAERAANTQRMASAPLSGNIPGRFRHSVDAMTCLIKHVLYADSRVC